MRSDTLVASLRGDALRAFQAGLEAVRPENLLPGRIEVGTDGLLIGGRVLPRKSGRRVLLALGKAAGTLCAAFRSLAPEWADEVILLTSHGIEVPEPEAADALLLRGAHPLPDAEGVESAQTVLKLAEGLNDHDQLIILLSGGGSALLAAPLPGIALQDIHLTTQRLLAGGAPIGAINTVRRELLAAGGGRLARAAYPAEVATLILSDVPNDFVPDIASGPTVPSPTGPTEALRVLGRWVGISSVPTSVLSLLETRLARAESHDEDTFIHSSTTILGSNLTARDAAGACLSRAGYRTSVVGRPLVGEASQRGSQLAALAAALRPTDRYALVLGGETTVTVVGNGSGGRNQELALAAAAKLPNDLNCAVLAAGTDGVDGSSANAGAVVDPGSWNRITCSGIDPARALANNDSATALGLSGDSITTGPTGTNVCDLTLLLVSG